MMDNLARKNVRDEVHGRSDVADFSTLSKCFCVTVSPAPFRSTLEVLENVLL